MTTPRRLLLAPSEVTQRLILSLVAAACANLIGSLNDVPPTGWQWIKIVLSTIGVVVVNWRAFISNPQQTTADPVPAAPDPAPTFVPAQADPPKGTPQ